MRSLTFRFLLWFLAVMLVTAVGFVFTTARILQRPQSRQHLMGRVLDFEAEEAVHAYQTGGKPALAAYIHRAQEAFGAYVALTDAKGRDLLTGADRSALIARARNEYRLPEFRARVIAREIGGGRYWFLVIVPQNRPGFAFFFPQYLWIVAVVALLSYLLAIRVTSPIRKLRAAVERFGKGDFGARVDIRRKDEFGRLAATFNEMAERIQKLLAAERRLLLDISHELRSPLARLAVAVELARSGEDRDAALDRIQKEADRLNALVGELLQVTRAEGDPSAMRIEDVRLDELLRDIAADCDLEARMRRCRVAVESAEPLSIKADPEVLRRAVENVVRNALRHAPADSFVDISAASSDDHVRISVRDYGPGVPEEFRQAIFEPFFRVEADRGRASGGTGLGLAIARRAVELHRGSIAARNAQPGLIVEMDLPRNFYTPESPAPSRKH